MQTRLILVIWSGFEKYKKYRIIHRNRVGIRRRAIIPQIINQLNDKRIKIGVINRRR